MTSPSKRLSTLAVCASDEHARRAASLSGPFLAVSPPSCETKARPQRLVDRNLEPIAHAAEAWPLARRDAERRPGGVEQRVQIGEA